MSQKYHKSLLKDLIRASLVFFISGYLEVLFCYTGNLLVLNNHSELNGVASEDLLNFETHNETMQQEMEQI